jgi:hypothetical protein
MLKAWELDKPSTATIGGCRGGRLAFEYTVNFRKHETIKKVAARGGSPRSGRMPLTRYAFRSSPAASRMVGVQLTGRFGIVAVFRARCNLLTPAA